MFGAPVWGRGDLCAILYFPTMSPSSCAVLPSEDADLSVSSIQIESDVSEFVNTLDKDNSGDLSLQVRLAVGLQREREAESTKVKLNGLLRDTLLRFDTKHDSLIIMHRSLGPV